MALKHDPCAMTLSVVPWLVNLAAGNAIVKSWDEFIFSLMHICVMVDVILLYCSLSGRIINGVVDLGDVFSTLAY